MIKQSLPSMTSVINWARVNHGTYRVMSDSIVEIQTGDMFYYFTCDMSGNWNLIMSSLESIYDK